MSRKNNKKFPLPQNQMELLLATLKSQMKDLSPDQLAQLYANLPNQHLTEEPLNVAKITKALNAIREFVQAPETRSTPVPFEAIARLASHSSKEEHMRKLYELQAVDVALAALTKLTSVTPSHFCGAQFDDAGDKQERQKIICGLLFSIGELAINHKNRDDMAQDGVVVQFAVAFLARTQNNSYRLLLFKILSELAPNMHATKKMWELDVAKYFLRDGLVDVKPILWTPAILSARPDLDKMEYHMICSAARGLLIFLQVRIIDVLCYCSS